MRFVHVAATILRLSRRVRFGQRVALACLLAASGILGPADAAAEKVRVAMPSRSMTFLSFYVAEKFGLFRAEGLEVSFEVMKSDIGVAAVISG